MATVDSATSALSAAASTSGTGTTGKNEIAGNFQDFLLLLTTQLKNQSPLDPLDTNQFTQQLVQFAGVEQQLKSNDTLTSILSAMKASSTANASSYVGIAVTADGSIAELANNKASWTLDLPRAAPKATITIKDADGTTVATRTQALKAGSQVFTWDGRGPNGIVQAAGNYSISVSATDASGQRVTASTEISGTVSAVDVSGASPVLTVGANQIPLARVKTIASRQ